MYGGRKGKHRPFHERPLCRVREVIHGPRKRPAIEVDDSNLLIFIRLVKLGYGDFEKVRQLSARVVVQALNYEVFCDDYADTEWELNKNEHS